MNIKFLHTLGPEGTNCQLAAQAWFEKYSRDGMVHLYPTLEEAVKKMPMSPGHALMACIAYPELHTLMFSNLTRLRLVDCHIFPTHNMVLASGTGKPPGSVISHPAPAHLIPSTITDRKLANSNADAAIRCARGDAEGCITTLVAADSMGLTVIHDFGPIHMGFSIHAPVISARVARPRRLMGLRLRSKAQSLIRQRRVG